MYHLTIEIKTQIQTIPSKKTNILKIIFYAFQNFVIIAYFTLSSSLGLNYSVENHVKTSGYGWGGKY